MTARVLVVGLDAGDPTTARELAAEGRMPALARLLDEAALHPMTEPLGGSYVSERWTSMVTGVGPEAHGYWCFADVDPDRFADRRAPLDAHRLPRIWDLASSVGRRVAVFDVPRQPLARVNGIHLDSWGTHDQLNPRSWPPDLLAQLDARFGPNPYLEVIPSDALPANPCDLMLRAQGARRTTSELGALMALIQRSTDLRARISEHLLATDAWDLFFTVFAEPHCAGHQCWHLHEPTTAREIEQAAKLGDAVADVYERIDASLARHLALAGPDATVVVVLHTGMTRAHGGNDLLGQVIARIGGPDAPYRLCEYQGAIGAIRLRILGRDPGGAVPQSDADAVASTLVDQLMMLVDERTGAPAVRAVRTRAAQFPRVVDDRLPDLFVEWNGDDIITSVTAPGLGSIHRAPRTARTGEHTPDGLIVVTGADAGARGDVLAPDLAPMLARMLGIDYETAGWSTTASASSVAKRLPIPSSQK